MDSLRDLVLGTAGHIDHGKTSLVRALTGVDTDRLPAEKQRGITIDLGFASLDLGDRKLAVVDVPGHERFIRNMVAGATGIDLALLVIAADDSVMPQTREHLEILRLLDLAGGLVALTKCDLVDENWITLVEEEVRTLLHGSFLQGCPIVPTSVTTGRGIDDLKETLRQVCQGVPERVDLGLFRMPIDRTFTVAGHGTVVTGTVVSGSVHVGDELEWLPSGKLVRVRGLQRHDRPVDLVGRGVRAAINLTGVHHSEILRGHELATPGYLYGTRAFAAEIQVSADSPRGVRHRARYRVHMGTTEVTGTLALLDANEKKPGDRGIAQLFLAEPVSPVHGEPFVLREESPPATLGGGRVIQPQTRRVRRRDPLALDRFQRLSAKDPRDRLTAALASAGLSPRTDSELTRETGIPLRELPKRLEELREKGDLIELAIGPKRTIRLLREFVADLEQRVIRALGRLHEAHPRQSSIPRTHLIAELPDLKHDALINGLIERLKTSKVVLADARTVALSNYEPKLSQGEKRLKTDVALALKQGGYSPPDQASLATIAGNRATVLPELLALLVAEERAVAIGPGLYLDFDVAADLRARVESRLRESETLTMAELRDLLSTTRKFAVPIGEYLDRAGVTQRDGDLRRLNPALLSKDAAQEGVSP